MTTILRYVYDSGLPMHIVHIWTILYCYLREKITKLSDIVHKGLNLEFVQSTNDFFSFDLI